MTVGMSGVAGTILAAYASLLGPASLPYLLAASFMAAPGGLLMAKIIMPDDHRRRRTASCRSNDDPEEEVIKVAEHDLEEERAANLIMAASTGALDRRARSRSRSARWCWRSSRWSRSPTACSAASGNGGSTLSGAAGRRVRLSLSASRRSSAPCSRR
jgi:hypothetical protein